jgi:ferredoxin-NADP reductase
VIKISGRPALFDQRQGRSLTHGDDVDCSCSETRLMPPSPITPPAKSATQRVASLLTHLGVSEHAFDDTLSLISPLLTVNRIHAKVTAKRSETPSACTLVLQAGSAFQGLVAGQYVTIGVVINGARHRRAYSPRTIDGHADQFAITVQRQVGGKVSNFIHDNVKVGDIIEIEAAAGDFVLGEPLPANVLMIAGGSGITPCMSMIEDLHRRQAPTRTTLIYFARSQSERIFARELQSIASRWPGLTYVPLDSMANTAGQAPAEQPALNAALLAQHAPAWTSSTAYCCGPSPLMDAARALWKEAGLSHQLKLEAFGAGKPSGDPSARHQVSISREGADMTFEAPGNQTVLESGEKAGYAIKHGCRQGICHECVCRLKSGIIKDLTTGEQIDGDGQPVRLCVSAALSDLQFESLN